MAAQLRQLLQLLQVSVEQIEARCEYHDVDFPSLNSPSHNSDITSDADVQKASAIIIAAAHQLIASVQQPQMTVFNAGCSYYLSASLRTAVETNVVEILREAGPQGMHVQEIASRSNVDPWKLSRFLCYLATHHIFKELSPDVYTNNRISAALDTGKSAQELFAKPMHKYDGTNGVAALIAHCADEDYKGAGFIVEHLTDPATAFEDSPERSPMMLAFNSTVGVWPWLEEPSNKMRLRRFGVAMDGVSKMQPPNSILKGFDWASLPEGSLIVDVGGGIGVSSITLAQAHSHLRCTVQDRPLVIEQGKAHCEQIFPGALISGKVSYQAHDFFTAQPEHEARVFILKQIIHDWSDRYARLILKRLREGATKDTQLVIIDSIILHSCPQTDIPIPGADFSLPPTPLLANMGHANVAPYTADLSMYVHFNGTERTLRHMAQLLKTSGWEVVRVHASDGLARYLPQIVAVPSSME